MQQILNLRNRMREIRSSGSVGVRGGNDPLYPEGWKREEAWAWVSSINTTLIPHLFLIQTSLINILYFSCQMQFRTTLQIQLAS